MSHAAPVLSRQSRLSSGRGIVTARSTLETPMIDFTQTRPNPSRAFRRTILVFLLAATGWPRPGSAQGDRSAIPEFTGNRVVCSEVPDIYGPLREDIARIERTSPQT